MIILKHNVSEGSREITLIWSGLSGNDHALIIDIVAVKLMLLRLYSILYTLIVYSQDSKQECTYLLYYLW